MRLEFVEEFKENLYSGDPIVREWFMIKSDYAPLLVCLTYVMLVKVILPAYMKDRKPYSLRNIMIVYNFGVVLTYIILMTTCWYYFLRYIDVSRVCHNDTFNPEIRAEYVLVLCVWLGYLLKYFEFLDTIFFVLRKKNHLVSHLHVLHHMFVPLMAWIVFRSEKTGFQAFPAFINTCVHIVMYTYYGLAAIGPSMQKYLWWKRYLTIAQMVQFVLMILYVVVVWPMTGCPTVKFSKYMTSGAALLFFGLFYNFYFHTFQERKKPEAVKENICSNGLQK